MNKLNLKNKLRQDPFLLDGAMGTQLFSRGVEIGTCSDKLNLDSPGIVLAIQTDYVKAGSDAVITNTFGANCITLSRHGLSDQVEKINEAAVAIAKKAAGPDGYVLGDIGPSGDFLEPLGTLKSDDLKKAFVQQAKSLLDTGVEGFIIETMTAIDELKIALEAVKSVSVDLPVLASMAFDKAADSFKTMMGVDVTTAVSTILAYDVDAVGFNCGTVSLDEYVQLARLYVETVHNAGSKVLIYAEPNAGKPELENGQAVYKVTPDEFAHTAQKIYDLGVSIIGGCCGTGPAHIEAVSKKLR